MYIIYFENSEGLGHGHALQDRFYNENKNIYFKRDTKISFLLRFRSLSSF